MGHFSSSHFKSQHFASFHFGGIAVVVVTATSGYLIQLFPRPRRLFRFRVRLGEKPELIGEEEDEEILVFEQRLEPEVVAQLPKPDPFEETVAVGKPAEPTDPQPVAVVVPEIPYERETVFIVTTPEDRLLQLEDRRVSELDPRNYTFLSESPRRALLERVLEVLRTGRVDAPGRDLEARVRQLLIEKRLLFTIPGNK